MADIAFPQAWTLGIRLDDKIDQPSFRRGVEQGLRAAKAVVRQHQHPDRIFVQLDALIELVIHGPGYVAPAGDAEYQSWLRGDGDIEMASWNTRDA